jgi:hypothetical protein
VLTLDGTTSGKIQLNEEQVDAMKAIFATGIFSLEHCFKMWESKRNISSIYTYKRIGQSKIYDMTQMKMDWIRFLPEESGAILEGLQISDIEFAKNFAKSIDLN